MTRPLCLAALVVLAAGCADGGLSGDALFHRVDPAASGVAFENALAEDAGFNILNYLYYYNGGGVAAGDVDGDGLPDLYFTANEGPNKLYLNRTEPAADGASAELRFEDATEAAGVAGTSDWTTGVTMADVDGDGRLDLYVSALGGYRDRRGRNELFLNEGPGADGVPRFREAAAEVGLDFEGFGTQAVFFDYDRDGDLDAYLLNHAVHTDRTYQAAEATRVRDERSGDRLYRNDLVAADAAAGGVLRFTEVTEEAGILSGISGYGLSIVTSDLDGDGWPDLYVGNDFHENDYVYLNNRDGTFREVSQAALGHSSRFSMGADAGDVDGDGRPDLVVLDMLPRREAILKTSAGDDTYDIANIKLGLGYGPQLARNTLQANRGLGADGVPRFSDVGAYAEIEATDWSWSALLADLDLDGRRDLYITNGIWRRPNDLDYINYVGGAVVQQALASGAPDDSLGLFEKMPQVALPNEAFRNVGGFRFEPADGWGLADDFFSNGTAAADLDNDGDLDLVVNNINAPAAVYQSRAADGGARSLRIELDGDGANTGGVGATVTVWAGGEAQAVEAFPTRGYLSSSDPRLVVGLGAREGADSVRVVWPDGRAERRGATPAGALTLRQADADAAAPPAPAPAAPLFADVTDAVGLAGWRHRENAFIDFNRERLMPHMLSRLGPAMAVGDATGDGLDDLFLGGAEGQPSALYVQTAAGAFREASGGAFAADSASEDVVARWFDADGDGALDLYVGTAGNRQWGEAAVLRDRLYLGDGAGGLALAPDALPELYGHTGAVAVGDWDGDGDADLFVGGRVVPREYGRPPRSALLENDGAGRFRDVTAEAAPALERVGMVADAAWADLDGDAAPELVVVGEWMAPMVFRRAGGALAPAPSGLEAATGWWNALDIADLDGDGHADLLLGNLGLNSRVRASAERPARLTLADFDGNDQLDGVLTTFRDGDDYPFATALTLSQQFPQLRQRFPTATDFGARSMDDIFGPRLADADVLDATTFASAIAFGDGAGGFALQPLPALAQAEPMFAAWAGPGPAGGALAVLGGGLLGVRPDRGRYDGRGVALRVGPGRAVSAEPMESGLLLDGEVRQIAALALADGARALVAAASDGPLRVFRLAETPPPGES